jgi:hypothetical protein
VATWLRLTKSTSFVLYMLDMQLMSRAGLYGGANSDMPHTMGTSLFDIDALLFESGTFFLLQCLQWRASPASRRSSSNCTWSVEKNELVTTKVTCS